MVSHASFSVARLSDCCQPLSSLCSNIILAFEKHHHQLELAKAHGADKVWIVNVGDLKPHEISIDFFMSYAWNTTVWTKDNLDQYRNKWALREFGSEPLAPTIATILKRFTRMNFRVKSENTNSTTYSLTNYRE